MGISTHVLDTAAGRPAAGVSVRIERRDGDAASGAWSIVRDAATDADGRVGDLVSTEQLAEGAWRITFATGDWYAARGERCFHPEVTIAFTVHDPDEHHHVPLLVTPWAYSTYRGS